MPGASENPWPRRCATIPAYLGGFALATATLPVAFPLLVMIDLVRAKPFPLARAAAFGWMYLACEAIGISAAFLLWAVSLLGNVSSVERNRDRHSRLQRLWAGVLFEGARAIFGLRVQIEGDLPNGRGRQILFFRHASLPDVILPSALWLVPGHLRVRHVMKKELLWDPCLDIVGRRLPNVFVDRDGRGDGDVRRVRSLADGLEDGEGIMIFPEGTRFTHGKRERILARLRERGDAEAVEYATSLKRLLPPRLGGSLAILEGAKGADAVFVAHVGFEATNRAGDFLNGSLIDRRIRVRIWRVPFDEIPCEREDRARWLKAWWKRMDVWIATCEKSADSRPHNGAEA